MIVFLSLQGFYVGELGNGWSAEPCIVAKDGLVLDSNAGAIARGIHPGISLKEARAIVHGCPVTTWEPGPYRNTQRRWLDKCAEYSDAIEPVAQHQAFVDLSAHGDPVLILGKLLEDLESAGFNPSVGVSRLKWLSRVAESVGDRDRDAYYDPLSFVAGLRIQALEPLLTEHRERLLFLGYRIGADVARLSLDVLRPQFGDAAIPMLQTVRAEGPVEQVRAMYPERTVVERFAFDGAAESSETIAFGLEHLSLRISRRLMDANLQGREIKVQLEMEDGEVECLHRKLTRPIQSYASVLFALRLVALAEPITQGIASIRVHLPRLERPREVQLRLDVTRSPEAGRKLTAMVEGLRGSYGDAAVELGEQKEVPRRSKVLRAWKDATGWA